MGDGDVRVDKTSAVLKKKKKLLTRDVENVNEADVVLNDVDGWKYSKNKGKFIISDGQNDEEDDVIAGDVDAKNVASRDDQNVEEDIIANVVVDDVQSPENNGKKRVKVLGDGNVPKEINGDDFKDFTFMFPELTNMLELKTQFRMPQHIRKKSVTDTINSIGWEKTNELEQEWINVRLMEMELKAKKLDLTSKQMNMILEATHKIFKS
ncbi:hypothetical protein POM88_040168 [Heracleum sosnowskyi]|uniref:Uncharacterized protein n=1 Tax=Heracleum sosnowskyi TaxID=360622 RepID=A0AAD8M9J9_9APIA|nr:hypothetical protein POM88_040168 [Heracleum sosnowskyi]